MDSTSVINPNGKRILLFSLLLLQFTWIVTIIFDLSVFREILGFLYLTFVPGYVIIQLLSMKKIDSAETVLFSVGISLAFLMFGGLCLNDFASLLNISKPLSVVPLALLVTVPVTIGAILSLLNKEHYADLSWSLPETPSLSSLIFVVLPILAVVGAICVNAFGNNLILLGTIVLIGIVIGASVFSDKIVPSKNYTILILMIAVALLLHASLISPFIYGNDIHLEFYLAQLTRQNGFWDSTAFAFNIEFGRYNSMLSITILPTIYTTLLDISETLVFKIIFPLIFSFVPLVMYKALQKRVDKKIALISVFLLVSQSTFFTEMLGLARQMIAELFFVLLVFVMLNDKFDSRNKLICWLIFSFGLIVSHYSLALIFVFFISAIWLFSYINKKRSNTLTLNLILLFFVLMFSWYIFSAGSASFQSIQVFGDRIINSLGDFFNPESRGSLVVRGLGLESAASIWQTMSRMFAYATEILIVFGFIALLVNWKKDATKWDFVALSFSGMLLLAIAVLVPRFASSLNMTRFYHIILFVVAPLFALGSQAVFKYVVKSKKQILSVVLIIAVLVPYFLFQTGFVYEVTGSESWSVPLSHYRMDKMVLFQSSGFLDEHDIYGAQWLSQNIDTANTHIYSDSVSRYKVLTSQGMIYTGYILVVTNVTDIQSDSVVYFTSLNTVYGDVVSRTGVSNYTDFAPLLDNLNRVYSNGGSEIYTTIPAGNTTDTN